MKKKPYKIKVGDLVRLGMSATRRGLSWQNGVGIVVEIESNGEYVLANFSGTIVKYPINKLKVINDSR